MTRYAKALTALLGSLATWGVTAAEDSTYTQSELWGLLLVLATALGVFAVPNKPPRGSRRRPDQSEQAPDAGHADAAGLAVVFGASIIVVTVYHLLVRYA